jgi:hypothetical protein
MQPAEAVAGCRGQAYFEGMQLISRLAAAALLAALVSCSNEPDHYLEVVGGGFAFNYRIAEATADIIVAPVRDLPVGAAVEVTFEDPAGGGPFVLRKDAPAEKQRIDFTTPPLQGIIAGKGYAVTVRLLAENGSELERIEKTFRSELDQTVLPEKPLTIGPGYAPNPG